MQIGYIDYIPIIHATLGNTMAPVHFGNCIYENTCGDTYNTFVLIFVTHISVIEPFFRNNYFAIEDRSW